MRAWLTRFAGGYQWLTPGVAGPGSEGAPWRLGRCSGNVCRVECQPSLEAEGGTGWPGWRSVGPQRRGQTGQLPEVRVQFRVRWRGPGSGPGESGELHAPWSGLGAPDRILAHPQRPAPTCSWGGGSRWGPLIANQDSRQSWPSSGEVTITGQSAVENHLTAQPLPGNGNRKNLGDAGAVGSIRCGVCGRHSDSYQSGGRSASSLWDTQVGHRWAVLRLSPWVLGSNCSLLLGPCGVWVGSL